MPEATLHGWRGLRSAKGPLAMRVREELGSVFADG
ncbi:hypothetical protein ABIA31_009493 [Catenulispora sp. MAP5-51]